MVSVKRIKNRIDMLEIKIEFGMSNQNDTSCNKNRDVHTPEKLL